MVGNIYITLSDAIKSLFEDTLTVYGKTTEQFNQQTYETELIESNLYENIPCRISFVRSNFDDGEMYDKSKQEVKVFTDANVFIPAGSKMTVIRNGMEFELETTDEPHVYESHMEYTARLERGYR